MRRTPTGRAMVAGVVGQPIGHSLSPLLHTAWIEAAGLDAAYVPMSAADDREFAQVVHALRRAGFRGLNVTLPFKLAALALADAVHPSAVEAGAANLLLFGEDGIEARNTDGIGLLDSLRRSAPDLVLTSGPVAILGAGGAGRGAAAALRGAGATELRIVNRTFERAEALAAVVGGSAYRLEDAASAFEGAALIVNTTSGGVGSEQDHAWPIAAAPSSAVLLDMRYGRVRSPLLQSAEARGMLAIDGLGMLIGQARPSFEAFYGVAPPDAVDAERLLREAIA